MNADDRDYFLKRASEEDEAARASASLAARWRHLYRMRVLAFDRTVIEEEAADSGQLFILVPTPPQTEAA